jgi:hypothetical protein
MSVRAKRGGTTWAQIQSIVASLEASSTWSATAAAALTAVVTAANLNDTTCPRRRGRHSADPHAGWFHQCHPSGVTLSAVCSRLVVATPL